MPPLSRREALNAAATTAAALAVGAGLAASDTALAATEHAMTAMHKAATDFLAALGPDLAARAQLPFNSEERFDWHYVPKVRKGLPYKEMNPTQQQAARALLRTGLSAQGLERTETIRKLENVLRELEQGHGPTRDPELYYFTVFGEPSERGAWGWRYEGHHVSLNFTLIDGQCVATTPQFFGANPAEVRSGPMKGTRALAAEEDLGRALVKSLTAEQRQAGILSATAPGDIVTGAARKAGILEERGIAYDALTKDQQGMLIALIHQYASLQAPDQARRRLDALRKAGLNTVKFAWMGGLEKGEKHYYRVQGRTFLIEYDNTQNDANHIHTVWRDFDGDWGSDLLARHYHAGDHVHDHV